MSTRGRIASVAAGILLAAGCSSAPAQPVDDPYDVGYAVGAEKSASIRIGEYVTTVQVTQWCTARGNERYADVTPQLRFGTGCDDALNKRPRNPR